MNGDFTSDWKRLAHGLIALLIISLGPLAVISTGPGRAVNSDLMAYRSATDLFWSGLNPYDPPTLAKVQAGNGPFKDAPRYIWNPPVLLQAIGFFSVCSPPVLLFGGAIVGIAAAFGLLWLGAAFNRRSLLDAPVLAAIVLFSSAGFWAELNTGQISAVVSFLVLLGGYAFLRGQDRAAGVLLVCGVIKPHVAFFPFLLLPTWALLHRRWAFFQGAVAFLFCWVAAAEVVSPGAFTDWVLRPSWPTSYVGSTLAGLFRALAGRQGAADPRWLLWVMPLLGMALLWACMRKRLFQPSIEALALAAAFSPLFAPYGFIVDQTILIFPVLLMIFSRGEGAPPDRRVVGLFMSSFLISPALGALWYLQSAVVCLMVTWWALCRGEGSRPQADHK